MTALGQTSNEIQTNYMNLLITQLRNQNPLEPMDNNEMASQLAQLSQLEQMQNMNSTFAKVLASQQFGQANSLIGREVAYMPPNAAEVVWGSDIFLAFYEEPELLRDLLDLITRTYAAFMRQWHARVQPEDGESTHWEIRHRGRLMIRNDSLMNLSPGLYVEYVRPLDQRLLDEFGGGAIHFCGKGSHYIEAMSQVRGLYGIQMSQPHLNDMETIYRHTVDKGIPLLSFDRKTAEAAKAAGRKLRGRVQC